MIRRNPRAYALYREAADAFTAQATRGPEGRRRRRRARAPGRTPRSSYDPVQRLDKTDLVRRIRALELELDTERRRHGTLAHDQQALLTQILHLETEVILSQAERTRTD